MPTNGALPFWFWDAAAGCVTCATDTNYGVSHPCFCSAAYRWIDLTDVSPLAGANAIRAIALGDCVDTKQIVATYGAAWNEPDEAKRASLLEQSWADDGIYTDPTATADGRAALAAHIAGFREIFPGRTIEQASGVDVTDGGLRFAWVMRNGDDVELEGMDFVELAPDGRIKRIAGFFGPFPPLDD